LHTNPRQKREQIETHSRLSRSFFRENQKSERNCQPKSCSPSQELLSGGRGEELARF
jgi:hypothetical protein